MYDKQKEGKIIGFFINQEGVLQYQEQLCVPKVEELRRKILEEAYKYSFSINHGASKMYQDLKRLYWWEGMKKDVTNFPLFSMPTSEGGTSKTSQVVTTLRNTELEIGANCNGFYIWFALKH